MDLTSHDDLGREAYGLLGIVVDADTTTRTIFKIKNAAMQRASFGISTANVNYLILSLSDRSFRSSILQSDLCTADGMPIVWLARLLGVPLRERVAGSDLFAALKRTRGGTPLRVFLLGGAPDIAQTACSRINSTQGGLNCIGSLDPGHGTAEDLSTPEIIRAVNVGGADLLAVSLGAKKAQRWFALNWQRVSVPVRIHVGATFNFESGDIKRAPRLFKALGFEWAWRIKEEPHLWRRYFGDGLKLVQIFLFRALPLTCFTCFLKILHRRLTLVTLLKRDPDRATLVWSGTATAMQLERARTSLKEAISTGSPVFVDMKNVRVLDSRITGLLVMARKQVGANSRLLLINVPRSVRFLLRLNGFADLIHSSVYDEG